MSNTKGQLSSEQSGRKRKVIFTFATIDEFYGLPNGAFQKYIEKKRAKALADEIKRKARIAAARKGGGN